MNIQDKYGNCIHDINGVLTRWTDQIYTITKLTNIRKY